MPAVVLVGEVAAGTAPPFTADATDDPNPGQCPQPIPQLQVDLERQQSRFISGSESDPHRGWLHECLRFGDPASTASLRGSGWDVRLPA